jgi:uncharacterized protein (DUF1810 family)
VTETDLIRFVDAQAQVYSQVVEELTDGHKRTHWMWFIFPQLSSLGHSAMAQRYAIRDMNQARRYLADPILGDRLRHDVRLIVSQRASRRWKFSDRRTISSFDPASPCSMRPPPINPTVRYSRRLCSNSTKARRTPGP